MKTVKDTYYVQQQARRILKCLLKPDYSNLKVHSKYLNGINKAQFWEAFGELRRIFESYYTEAVKNPSNLSLPVYEIDKYRNMSNEAREGNTALLDFPKTLFAAGLCAKLNKNVWCNNCAEKCKLRIVYELDGKEKRACGCFPLILKILI